MEFFVNNFDQEWENKAKEAFESFLHLMDIIIIL